MFAYLRRVNPVNLNNKEMFYSGAWDKDDEVDDWDTDTDAINTENIRSGASAAEKLEGRITNAAEAAAVVF